jgi:catechol 2,3-dioxygenase-like lactoylglutathione lyase family enzyme
MAGPSPVGTHMDTVVGMYTFTSPDQRRLAAFWAELMGLPLADTWPDDPQATVFLDFDHEVTPVTWLFEAGEVGAPSDRLGLDLGTEDGSGWRELADRAEALGASRESEHEQSGARWIVLRDPDGNRFRVFGPRPE